MDAVGVGGISKFIGSYQMPVAIGGIPGILQVHTIAQPIPLLLPIAFCLKLEMNLLLPAQKVHWSEIDRAQDIHIVGHPKEGHVAINIFEFDEDGWHSPFNNYDPEQSRIVGSKESHDTPTDE